MEDEKVKGKGICSGGLMMKRRRGRPRKNIHSHYLAQEMVNFSNSDNLPEFFKIYMAALCSEMLRIPPDFVEKFGGNIPSRCEIKRACGGVSLCWEVDMKRVNGYWFWEKGWPNFVEENSLGEGDFLTFCYVGKWVFNVKIFSPNGCLKGAAAAAANTSRSMPNIVEVETPESESCERITSKWGTTVKYINGNPCFTMVIMKTHLKQGFVSAPVEFWRAHAEKSVRSVRLWVGNDAWEVGVENSGYTRVRFKKGCAKFIQDNSLKLGTLCTFHLIHTANTILSFKLSFST